MNRSYISYFIVLITLVSICLEVKSQDLFVNAAGERIQACTDRTMYVSGEKVFFSVVVFNEKNITPEEFSRTFYCELITPDGKKIADGKYLLQNSTGQGCLTIPDEIISGIYFLKFYTRFMRNISAVEYKYIILKIINPNKTEVLSWNDTPDTTDMAGKNRELPAGDHSLNILSGKKNFSPREEIRLNIRGINGKELPAMLCLSVIPESSFRDMFFSVKNELSPEKNGVYFPETRSISLSGQLMAKESGKPVPDAKVNLSIIGDKDILVVYTDSSGRFFFTLPAYHGNKDIFLCASDLPEITPEILIDNDFCSKPVNLSSPRFTMNEEEMKTAYKLAVDFRITSMFKTDTLASDSTGEENNASFYGEPSDVLVLDKYIDLPTLEEYFSEIPMMVKVKKVRGRKQFRFNNTQAEMSMYDPLVLVDWVAMNDIEKILAMSPGEIERIELVTSPYVKGSITYGGIISFVSKKNDFAGIDLPKSGTFVNYKFLEDCVEDHPSTPIPRNIPDSRNTIYWNPSVQTNDDGTADISFLAPDTPGKYCILLRGISKTGEVVLTKKMVVVSGK